MKKENRKMAQQKKAQERKKQERKRKIKKFLAYFLPSAAVLILIFVLVFDSIHNSQQVSAEEDTASETSSNEATATDDASAEDASSDSSESTELSTDSSLTVEDGDTVNIDYVGTIDGEEFSGGSTDGSGTDLVIGSGSYIDDFEDQLIGAHPGDQVSVEVTFPDDYSNQELQGQDAVFSVTINGIYR